MSILFNNSKAVDTKGVFDLLLFIFRKALENTL